MNAQPRAELVLVGGGHAHVQVLRRWMMDPLPGVRVTVVVDRPEAVYSGMVPGLVAGEVEPAELEIDVVPLARRARARVILAPATRVLPDARRIELAGRPPLHYDVASLDVGSTVRGLELPGVSRYALATRPIRDFVDALAARLVGLPARPRVSVVGGGAAGVELAFTLESRIRLEGREPGVELVTDGEAPLPGSSRRLQARVMAALARRGIALCAGARVTAVEERGLRLEGGERREADLVVWATGAAPIPLLEASPLPRDERGFVRTTDHFLVEGLDDLFAVGDCASQSSHPWVPKAGVYAVRAGPVLDANLRARLTDRPLRRYRPQRDFLALLNLGGGQALGGKWGLAFEGAWVFRLKDRIDRRFMERFQVLDGNGEPAPGFPSPDEMEEMPCGGCAAKVGASALEAALGRLSPAAPDPRVLLGLDAPDDAAALRTPGGERLLATIDGFRGFTDDPFWVGRVAAVNALSDVFAKGGTPRHALAIVTVPEEDPRRAEETLFQVLAGARVALDRLGVSLVGGHSTVGPELFVGLSILGDAGPDLLALGQARPGDALVLTAPLGTGVVLAADMQGRARGSWLLAALVQMARSSELASSVARSCAAHAATDISGFGLAGHLRELLRQASLSATLWLDTVPALPGALALLERGVRSSYHPSTAAARSGIAWGEKTAGPAAELLFDPQTSGGLLLALPEERVDAALEALRRGGDVSAARIGTLRPPRADGALIAVERSNS